MSSRYVIARDMPGVELRVLREFLEELESLTYQASGPGEHVESVSFDGNRIQVVLTSD